LDGANAINYVDLNGHDFSAVEEAGVVGIGLELTALALPAIAAVATRFITASRAACSLRSPPTTPGSLPTSRPIHSAQS
jgi:hypothetical protein